MTDATARPDPELEVVAGRPFFSSWSGGKDSYLAYLRAVSAGGRPRALLCMLREDGRRTHSHALPKALIERQAESLGLPLVSRAASWDGYEGVFLDALAELRDEQAVEVGVFGDIDLQPHREWVERVCRLAGLEACLPLWQETRRALLDELFGQHVRATIVAVDTNRLDERLLGRQLDEDLVSELQATGVDACGEEGEFHTVVTDGPRFARPVGLAPAGRLTIDNYRFVDLDDLNAGAGEPVGPVAPDASSPTAVSDSVSSGVDPPGTPATSPARRTASAGR